LTRLREPILKPSERTTWSRYTLTSKWVQEMYDLTEFPFINVIAVSFFLVYMPLFSLFSSSAMKFAKKNKKIPP